MLSLWNWVQSEGEGVLVVLISDDIRAYPDARALASIIQSGAIASIKLATLKEAVYFQLVMEIEGFHCEAS
jgi:hypothetical protein